MKISTGIIKEPYFIGLYGTPGIGKTTFVSEAPRPIILDVEKGSKKIAGVSRNTDIDKFEDLLEAIVWLKKEKHQFETAVIDTLDAVEPMIFDYMVRTDVKGAKTIEDIGGGFQKGYTFAIAHWNELIRQLLDLREARAMNIIVVAHSKTVTVADPMSDIPYDKYTMKLFENKSVSYTAVWREKLDALLFATFEDTIYKLNTKDKKGKAKGEGVAKLYTKRTANYDAKNRLGLPAELPFSLGRSWADFHAAAELGQPDSMEQVQNDIAEISAALDAQTVEKMKTAVKKAGTDLNKLIGIRNHARILVEGT